MRLFTILMGALCLAGCSNFVEAYDESGHSAHMRLPSGWMLKSDSLRVEQNGSNCVVTIIYHQSGAAR